MENLLLSLIEELVKLAQARWDKAKMMLMI